MQALLTEHDLATAAEELLAFGESLSRLRERLLLEPETQLLIQDAETGRKISGTTSQITAGLQAVVQDMTRRLACEPIEDVIADPITIEGGRDIIALACMYARKLPDVGPAGDPAIN